MFIPALLTEFEPDGVWRYTAAVPPELDRVDLVAEPDGW
jgi:hypothetical protein